MSSIRQLIVWAGVFLVFVSFAVQAHAEDLNGSFSSDRTGENFDVQGNGDGTAEIYGQDGRHVGTAESNGDHTWDITSPSGKYLGQIENDRGSLDVTGSQGGYWGSGDADPASSKDDDDDSDDDDN